MEVWKLKPKYKGLQKKQNPETQLYKSLWGNKPHRHSYGHFFFFLLFLNLSNVHSVNDGLI